MKNSCRCNFINVRCAVLSFNQNNSRERERDDSLRQTFFPLPLIKCSFYSNCLHFIINKQNLSKLQYFWKCEAGFSRWAFDGTAFNYLLTSRVARGKAQGCSTTTHFIAHWVLKSPQFNSCKNQITRRKKWEKMETNISTFLPMIKNFRFDCCSHFWMVTQCTHTRCFFRDRETLTKEWRQL